MRLLALTILTFAVGTAAFGADPASPLEQLAESGIELSATLTADHSRNFQGGLSTHQNATRNLFDVNATFDLSKLAGIQGGTLNLDFYNQNGQDGSARLVGDLQAFSNIDADGRTQLSEIWYLQEFGDAPISLKIGKTDANADFDYVDYGGEFIHSSPGFSPTIFTFPTFPDPAFAAVLLTEPTDSTYFNFGVYDGSAQEGIPTGSRGPKTALENLGDLFLVAEGGVRFDDDRIGVGYWHHTGTFTAFDGSTDEKTGGLYLVVDKERWKEDPDNEEDEQGVGVFFQYGYADPHLSSVEHHLGVGVQAIGLLPNRDDDVTGIMVSWAKLTDEAGAGFTDHSETAIELFYRYQLGPHLSLKPDLQYIANPGGVGAKDAIVGTLRLEVGF